MILYYILKSLRTNLEEQYFKIYTLGMKYFNNIFFRVERANKSKPNNRM